MRCGVLSCGEEATAEVAPLCGYHTAELVEARKAAGVLPPIVAPLPTTEPLVEASTPDTLNRYAITAHRGFVVVGMAGALVPLPPEHARNLAAWLIVALELAGDDDARAKVLALVDAIEAA